MTNLESILHDIWNGNLSHNQNRFFCGTSCGIAGWLVAQKYPTAYMNFFRGVTEHSDASEAIKDPIKWATLDNDLNNAEAALLFSTGATKSLHSKILAALRAGRRLTGLSQAIELTVEEWSSEYYLNGVAEINTHNKEDRDALIEFLGDLDDNLVQV